MGPEDNPADERKSFPCPECDGDITKIDGEWCCNKCDVKLGGGE